MNCESIIQENQSSETLSSKQKNFYSKRYRNKPRFKVKNRETVLSKVLSNRSNSVIKVNTFNHLSRLTPINDNPEESPMITINVSGIRYQTYLSTIERYPDTLLGNKYKRIYYWNNNQNEYFFDRHCGCFESILYYYQSNGRLRRPDYVPLD